jgi:hypothetical protein
MKSLLRFDTSLARGVVCRPGRGSLGSPRESPPPVSMQRAGLHPTYRPLAFDGQLQPSTFVSPLQSSFALMLCPFPFGAGHLPGFVPSSRHHQSASTDRETSQASLRSVHRLSQPLDGLLRTLAPRLISSSSRVQGASRSGASLSAQRHPARRRWLPPRRCHDGRSTDLAGHGVHPHRASASRRSSARSRVREAPVISRRDGRSPPRVRSSSRLSIPLAPKVGYPPSTAHDVPATDLRLRDRRRRAPSAYWDRGTGRICLQTRRPARAY